jgi:hypothetical protein
MALARVHPDADERQMRLTVGTSSLVFRPSPLASLSSASHNKETSCARGFLFCFSPTVELLFKSVKMKVRKQLVKKDSALFCCLRAAPRRGAGHWASSGIAQPAVRDVTMCARLVRAWPCVRRDSTDTGRRGAAPEFPPPASASPPGVRGWRCTPGSRKRASGARCGDDEHRRSRDGARRAASSRARENHAQYAPSSTLCAAMRLAHDPLPRFDVLAHRFFQP